MAAEAAKEEALAAAVSALRWGKSTDRALTA